MNLHIMYDEKVISRAIQYFEEALPGQNKYIIFSNKRKEDRIVKTDLPVVLFTTYGSKEFWEFIGDTSLYKNIVLHYLSGSSISFVKSVDKTDNIVWIAWGGDLYNELLEPYGYKLYSYSNVYRGRYWKVLPWFYSLRSKYYAKRRLKAIRKIPRMVMLECDYALLKSYFPELTPTLLDFFYYPVNDMVDERLLGKNIRSNNIFVGNSSQQTNNHRMVFEVLSKCNISSRKVITPLSYGSSYGRLDAIKWGKELLGENFQPLTEFIPLEEYNNLMLSASVFIYGQFRQEAFGNIVVALYIGGIVVLHPLNPLLNFLKEKGFVIFSIEELPQLLDYTMQEKDICKNRKLIDKLYSRNRLLTCIKQSFG